MDLESKDYTLANLLILNIKRLIDKTEHDHKNFSQSDIVLMALNILRIMCEIPYGNGTEDIKEWQMFFDAQKDERSFQLFLHHLERMSLVKNELLNEIIMTTETKDMETLMKEIKGEYDNE